MIRFRVKELFIKRVKRWDRKLSLSKRQQFVGITLLLTIGMVLTYLAPAEVRYLFVFGLSLCTYILSAFALRQDLKGVEWVTLLSLPTLYTAAVCLFYFLLPTRWITRLPFAFLYSIGMYALLLTENIYNVAANRTIALLRAAHSIGFLITLVTFFLLSQTTLAFRSYGIVNTIVIGALSFLLVLQALWSMELATVISMRIKLIVAVITLCLMQLTWILAYLPIRTTMQALLLTTTMYCLVGMAQQYLVDRLYRRTVFEFFAVFVVVFVIVIISIRFRGGY